MFRYTYILAALLTLGNVRALRAEADSNAGASPATLTGATDIFKEFRLPRLMDKPSDVDGRSASELQMIRRARLLKLNADSATSAWQTGDRTLSGAYEIGAERPPSKLTEFTGTKSSELNALVEKGEVAVHVVSPALNFDQPLRIGAHNVSIDFGFAALSSLLQDTYMVRIEHAGHIRIRGGALRNGRWGLLISSSQDVLISNMDLGELAGGGILVTDSNHVSLWRNQIHGVHGSAILLHGNTDHTTVAENQITGNLGSSNWQAGIVITDRNAQPASDLASLLGSDETGPPVQPITGRLHGPHDNVIFENQITGNRSSGVYSDGTTRNIFVSNSIERNSKEGLCLDNGSTANVVAWNVVRGNGKRWGSTDAELKKDYILSLGRLPDGTSPAKLPGISVDNAIYNQLVFNQVDGNFGGGIKLVRAALFNVIGLNLLRDNDRGRNSHFHFFGIEVGAATADEKVADLDFVPSRGNELFGNTIRGSHYAGIFLADGSDHNTIFDNSIFGATNWALESVRVQPNTTLNNLTNLHSRNIDAGLDSNLLKFSSGIMDTSPPPPTRPAAVIPKD